MAAATTTPKDPWRPRVHFTPAVHWINDPNGLIWHDGEYHLFYQYNPQGDVWGHMSWGHAVSLDMLCWRDLPLAIPETNDRMAFSGSAVVDHGRTSGFGASAGASRLSTRSSDATARSSTSTARSLHKNTQAPLVAIYSGASTRPDKLQDQRVAWSIDRGRRWTLVKEPVLDIGSIAFRDPKVFFHEPTRRWVMLVSMADAGRLAFYTSTNLRQWTHASDWTIDIPGGKVWECPDLMQLPIDGESGKTAWAIKVDVFEGHPAGGSGAIVVVGDFDGTRFTAKQPLQWIDGGRDFYAAIAFGAMPPGDARCVWLGWMCDHRYGKDAPTSPWRGAMTIPREVRLVRRGSGLRVAQRPIAELAGMRGAALSIEPGKVGPTRKVLIEPGRLPVAHDLELRFDAPPDTAWRVGLRASDTEATVLRFDPKASTLALDRQRGGVDLRSGNFAAVASMPWLPDNDAPEGRTTTLRIVVDACSVEVFAGDGSAAITSLVFPKPSSTGVWIEADAEITLQRGTAWPLKAAMARQPSVAPKAQATNR